MSIAKKLDTPNIQNIGGDINKNTIIVAQ